MSMHEYLHIMDVPARPEEKAISPGTAVTDDCELSHACWEPKLGLLQEQQKFLTTEPFLKPCGVMRDFFIGNQCRRVQPSVGCAIPRNVDLSYTRRVAVVV